MLEGVALRLRKASDAVGLLKVLAVLSVIGPAAILIGVSWQSRSLLLENAERRSARMSDLLAQHASATFDSYNFAFARIEEHLRQLNEPWNEERLHAYLNGVDDQMKSTDGLIVLDKGWTIFAHSHHFPAPKLDTRDREFVRILRAQITQASQAEDRAVVSGKAGLAVSLPFLSRISNQPTLMVSRALRDGAGHLAGGLAITLSPDFFADVYRTVTLSDGDLILLRRGDGSVLARFPSYQPSATTARPPNIVPAPPVSADPPAAVAEGTTDIVSSEDGVRRIVSLRRIEGYPIFVEVGFGVTSVLSPWYRQIPVNLLLAALASLVLFGLTRVALTKSRTETRMQALVLAETRQRAAAEAALRQSQKMEALGQLTGGIAHDFNNLLNIVLINLELAAKWRADGRPADEPRFEGYLRGARQGAERGAALTGRLLTFARRRETETVDVPVSDLVFGLSEMLGQAAGAWVRITLDCPRGLRPARADPNELETALINLVVNARDAMPDGGSLHIAVREDVLPTAPPARDTPSTPAPTRSVVLSVRDTGCGMDVRMLARAAEPFFTTKEEGKGSGLGLAMVDRFADRAGGRLVLESRPGMGTTAEIWLPAAPVRAHGPDHEPALRTGAGLPQGTPA